MARRAWWMIGGVIGMSVIACASAGAGIVPVGVFAGEHRESFEGPSGYMSGDVSVFDGLGTMRAQGGGTILTGSWSFYSVVRPEDGRQLMGSPGTPVIYSFLTPGRSFGGYFATNSNAGGATAYFYGLDHLLIGSQSITVPTGGSWTWNGWNSDVPFGEVKIVGNYAGGGFVMQDNMQFIAVPASGSLALASLAAVTIFRRSRQVE